MNWKKYLNKIEKNYTFHHERKRLQELAGIKPSIRPEVIQFGQDLKDFVQKLKNGEFSNPTISENEDDEENEDGKSVALFKRIQNATSHIKKHWPQAYDYWNNMFNHNLTVLFSDDLNEDEQKYLFDYISFHLDELEDFWQTKF